MKAAYFFIIVEPQALFTSFFPKTATGYTILIMTFLMAIKCVPKDQ